MPTLQDRWQQIISYVQARQTTLASGLAALLIIVVGFLIFNFFLNVNKDTSPETTSESTESAQVSPTSTPAPPGEASVKPTATPTPTSKTAQVSPGGAASVTNTQDYIVVKGDTLSKIAQKVYQDGSKWKVIADANKLTNPNLIHAGNKLTIPKQETGVASSTPSQSVSAGSSAKPVGNVEYVVTRGDSLWQIAADFYGSGFEWYRILNANKDKISTLPNGRPLINPGQHLVIP